jgi:hypothetical protein
MTTKSPLEQVAYELEKHNMKRLLTQRFKHIEESVYERIRHEMHTDRFNEVLEKVIEKHGVKDSMILLTDCIEKVAYDSMLSLIKKRNKI